MILKWKRQNFGFQVEIDLPNSDLLNFCFKDSNDNWDNNDGKNYVFSIEQNSVSLVPTNIDELSLMSARRLRKSYILSKKLRLAIYKIITYLPKIISGNYKRKIVN